eukprot:172448-Prymnesium_polylepis.2
MSLGHSAWCGHPPSTLLHTRCSVCILSRGRCRSRGRASRPNVGLRSRYSRTPLPAKRTTVRPAATIAPEILPDDQESLPARPRKLTSNLPARPCPYRSSSHHFAPQSLQRL